MAMLTPPINKQDHIKGPRNAAVQLVEYGDYQCPYCAAAFPIVNAVERLFNGQMAFVFRHFPLAEIHPCAKPAAIAAEAADRQGKFWPMHNMLFQYQQQLSPKSLLVFAEELELNIKSFKADTLDPVLTEKVEAHFESGVRSGVNGTPSFFINSYKYTGAFDFDSLSGAVGAMFTEKYLH
jgi:protein-disulfide isomerase